jgi:hypothetical protein
MHCIVHFIRMQLVPCGKAGRTSDVHLATASAHKLSWTHACIDISAPAVHCFWRPNCHMIMLLAVARLCWRGSAATSGVLRLRRVCSTSVEEGVQHPCGLSASSCNSISCCSGCVHSDGSRLCTVAQVGRQVFKQSPALKLQTLLAGSARKPLQLMAQHQHVY